MKNGFVLFLAVLFSLPLLSQRNTSDKQYYYDKYMRSSHRKQTAGIIFLSSGAAVAAGGIVLIVDGTRRGNNQYYSDGDGLEQALGIVTTVIGVGFMGGSIPFFIGAHRSREKAMSFSFKAENTPHFYKSAFAAQKFPALALHIPLGR